MFFQNCLTLKKVDSQKSQTCTNHKQKKQELYFDKVIRLHYEKGYGEDRISTIIPVEHSTVNRWIRIFAAGKEKEKGVMPETKIKEKKTFSETAEYETASRTGEIARCWRSYRQEAIKKSAACAGCD